MTIYEKIIATGCKTDSHRSDFYCEKTPATTAIVNDYAWKQKVTTFRSAIEHTIWYDIPFAFDPFWDKLHSVKEQEA